MLNNITKSLSCIGCSNYELTIDGKLYKNFPSRILVKKDEMNRYFIIDDCGKSVRYTQKYLYRKLFNTEFCIDNTITLQGEEWKQIENTNGRYYISNCGRVKSLCGYTAKILQPYKNTNGYLTVKIQDKNKMIHQLVALYFCENKFEDQKIQIHHIDTNRQNNYYKNLQILSIAEHKKIHSKKEKQR